mmetsp:Transcript_121774/g.315984  ORF Transcript_121774/g.315984 Transcript_121774/m.315984 type:complete len:205 (+) Transcript_121774:205-819(+)
MAVPSGCRHEHCCRPDRGCVGVCVRPSGHRGALRMPRRNLQCAHGTLHSALAERTTDEIAHNRHCTRGLGSSFHFHFRRCRQQGVLSAGTRGSALLQADVAGLPADRAQCDRHRERAAPQAVAESSCPWDQLGRHRRRPNGQRVLLERTHRHHTDDGFDRGVRCLAATNAVHLSCSCSRRRGLRSLVHAERPRRVQGRLHGHDL